MRYNILKFNEIIDDDDKKDKYFQNLGINQIKIREEEGLGFINFLKISQLL